MPVASLSRFRETWTSNFAERASTLHDEFPDYYLSNPESLICSSAPHSFRLGTGASVYTRALIPAMLRAKHEVILVTCFWAPSPTLVVLKEALEALAKERCERARQAQASGSDADMLQPLRIRICFSSRSLFQKLFHTSSRDGYIYPPSTWPKQLGLPSQEVLEAGLIDLRIKTLFFLPFSVMHPKFLIVDRRRAWLPSCNVSWEAWLEGCVEFTGDAVDGLITFYRQVWDRDLESQLFNPVYSDLPPATSTSLDRFEVALPDSPASVTTALPGAATPTVILPSSHHRNPRFNLLPWHESPSPPPTPLNHATLQLLDMAKETIYLQTPNLTSRVVIHSLLDALERGVDVSIVTSKRLMLLEQIVTAGTTTSFCIRSLVGKYRACEARNKHLASLGSRSYAEPPTDIEAQPPRLGSLQVSYFRPNPSHLSKNIAEEPVQSHLKLTIIDGQCTLLGSGNMDRASWFTSQELGVMFQSAEFAATISAALRGVLADRLELVFSSPTARSH
ncbi:phospholipase D/nuclease [Durotheca rogersii]|uniref:phospholipase D/nuclease n=1 Tax=Durotheca rogersii TaxID=419775 RepID=UPI00221F2405|nr:phospholipase D/nuclease [Durotheca rogersii]KAI5865288.1 phospholipase D/nuclease [Durotheca rogersii]